MELKIRWAFATRLLFQRHFHQQAFGNHVECPARVNTQPSKTEPNRKI